MTTSQQSKLLGEALSKAKQIAVDNIVKSSNLERLVRERLVSAKYLTEVIRGWYILTTPDGKGTTTLWYSKYWAFIREYLNDRFSSDGYCLTPESSLDIYSGQNYISEQFTIMTKKPSNQPTNLMFGTSLFFYRDEKNFPQKMNKVEGLNLFPQIEALASVAPSYFTHKTINMEINLKSVQSVADISRVLLEGGLISAANRLMGAYERLGDIKTAKQIHDDMTSAGYKVKPVDPFKERNLFLAQRPRIRSPHAGRIEALWGALRNDVIDVFPEPPKQERETDDTLKIIEEIYREDTYNSLSIEGYDVTEELIEKIKEGSYNPEKSDNDRDTRDALAAKGYLESFKQVHSSIVRVLIKNEEPGKVFSDDVQTWYRHLFTPIVSAGLKTAASLAGYRNKPVYIKNSRHIPVPASAVTDSMEILEELLMSEKNPAVRAVLGHFIFGYIHPYDDGNGRIARFLMNFMLIAGGYNWTVIRTANRNQYLAALEEASTHQDIKPFTQFVAKEMKHWNDFTAKN